MDFQKHTSEKMVDLFNEKPYQGQSPEKAKIIYLSSDANYSPEISNHKFFNYILEYQKDGIAFWKKYGVHHPFLLPDYPFNKSRAGVPFHRNFSKISLGSGYAKHISFLELLDIPTIGNKSQNKKLFYDLVSQSHLEYIDALILNGGRKLFFVSRGVLKDMLKLKRDYPVFSWLDFSLTSKKQYSKSIQDNMVKEIYHFSAYQIHGQIDEIRSESRGWLDEND